MTENITALDLFAGSGGLSLGFTKSGVKVTHAIEIDDWAASTYAANHPGTTVLREDISNLSDHYFSAFKGVDLIMGGPPCQGFSISASSRRKKHDPRNFLYLEFLRTVQIVNPKAVFIENVKEIEKYKLEDGSLLVSDIYRRLNIMGYECAHFLVNASNYGVPQNRVRFFLFAFKSNILKNKIFSPSLLSNLLEKYKKSPLTIWDAVSDLPPVKPRELDEDTILPYNNNPETDYQKLLRKGSKNIQNHIPMRHTDRTVERFKYIRIHGNDTNLPEHIANRQRGNSDRISDKMFSQNYRVLDARKPSPTITASFYSSFIHPLQDRNLTVREAARIQSFPDNFHFLGKRTTLSNKLLEKKGIKEEMHLDQFNQVGNAVPPIMAEVLGKILVKVIKQGK